MGLRELLILILILAIVGVILRGLYVAIRARRGQLRVQLDKNIPQYDPEELSLSELPNGGARSVERSFAQVVQQNSEFSAKDRRKIASGEHAIPVLMDTVGEDDEEHEEEVPRQSSVATARDSARQKHLMGQRHAVVATVESRQHPDRDAATAATHQDVDLSFAPNDEQDDDDDIDDGYEEDEFDDDYNDPLDAHVFIDDEDEDEEEVEAPMQAYGDFRDPVVQQDDDDDLDDDDSNDGPSEDSVDPDGDDYDEDEDDFDDAPSEDSIDPDGFDDNDDWDDEDEDEDEDDVDEEEVDVDASEVDEGYRAPTQAHDDDLEDYGWDDESREPEEEVSAPRRWLQWAGDKISSMGTSQDTPVREREFDGDDRAEPVIGLDDFDDEPETPTRSRAVVKKEPLEKSRQAQLFADEEEEDEPAAAVVVPERAVAPKPSRRAAPEMQARSAEPEPEPEPPREYSEVMVINVVAKPDREFVGVELLPALLSSGLRFGDMNIFHRHFDSSAKSPVIFSVANMLNPGTFDLNQINDFSTRGLCFFMTLPNAANSMQAFDRMLDAAQALRIALDGDLKDDNRSVMTAQTIEHYRQRVRDFDLRQLRQPK